MKVQRILTVGTTIGNPDKLSDPRRIMEFLEMVASKLLKIKNASACLLGRTPTPENIKGKSFFVGGIVSQDSSIFIDAVPVDRTAEVKIFTNCLDPNIQIQIKVALTEMFGGE